MDRKPEKLGMDGNGNKKHIKEKSCSKTYKFYRRNPIPFQCQVAMDQIVIKTPNPKMSAFLTN
jgi:hypothetical protein